MYNISLSKTAFLFQVGPIELGGNLTAQVYNHFLHNELVNIVQGLPNNGNIWFQHDGAPAHTAHVNQARLNQMFPNRWIGGGGTQPWPARSPDLNPLDFFLWGAIKDRVYSIEIQNEDDLRQRIVQAFQAITPEMLESTILNNRRRIACCIQQNGGHIENFL